MTPGNGRRDHDVTADQKRMWLEWARGLESLGSGPKPAVRLQHTAMPCRRLPVRPSDSGPGPLPAAGNRPDESWRLD
jgi:hypothetical protein